jgi:hypothetical protein
MSARCECGRPDWPGFCPGPANCPCVDSRPECSVCGERLTNTRRATQTYTDDWLCEDCAAEECERQAETAQ